MSVDLTCSNPACAKSHTVPSEKASRSVRCSACGHTLVAGAGASATQVSPSKSTAPAGPRPGFIGRFLVRKKLGAGAFGTVYRAYDPQLDRELALKVPNPGAVDTPSQVKRFLREAKAAAGLRHPHIVPVFDAGQDGGRYYIASAFIDGQPLSHAIPARGMPFERAARLARELAEALAYAHDEGVVHRDVKPHNVMLDPSDHAHLMDFGLAARQDEEARLTRDGAVVGTPAYMSPEQARGQKGDAQPSTDQYAVGVVLYELLTGRVPFAGPVAVVLHQVVHNAPESPRVRRPKVPRELEAICLKALAKEPRDRYASCRHLADDLRRWQEGEPVAARGAGPVERAIKWARRKPTQAAACGLTGVSLALVALTAGAVWLWQRAEARQVQLALAQREAEAARGAADRQREEAEAARQTAEGARQTAEGGLRREARLRGDLDRVTYLNRVGLSYREWQDGNLGRTRQLLDACPEPRRGWEWRYVDRLLDTARTTFARHTNSVWGADFSPDGRLAVSGAADGTVHIWDPDTGAAVRDLSGHTDGVWGAVFSPDGAAVATCSADGTVRMWDAATGDPIWKGAHTGSANGVAFSPDGTRLVSVAGDTTLSIFAAKGVGGEPRNEAKVWDARSGRELRAIPLPGAAPLAVAFSPDGKHAAVGQFDGAVGLWNCASGERVRQFVKHRRPVKSLAFSPDGAALATASQDGLGVLWAAADGRPAVTFAHPATVRSIAFCSGGAEVVTACDDSLLRVWDRAGGLAREIRGHSGFVTRVTPDRTGRRLLSCGHDRTARVWDGANDQQLFDLRGHTSWVTQVAGGPGGAFVASAARDGTVRFWDPVTRAPLPPVLRTGSKVFPSVAVRADGRMIAAGEQDSDVGLWDRETGRKLARLTGHTGTQSHLAFSPDGRLLASVGHDGAVLVWDTETYKLKHTARFRGETGLRGGGVAFHPNGRLLAFGASRAVVLWDLATDQRAALEGHSAPVAGIAFSPDGSRLASAAQDNTVQVWDTQAKKRRSVCVGHGNIVHEVVFSPDGSRLASAGEDATVRVWLPDTGEEALVLRSNAPVYTLAFLPDGERLVTGDPNAVVRVEHPTVPAKGRRAGRVKSARDRRRGGDWGGAGTNVGGALANRSDELPPAVPPGAGRG